MECLANVTLFLNFKLYSKFEGMLIMHCYSKNDMETYRWGIK
jgi:hypothetical protein